MMASEFDSKSLLSKTTDNFDEFNVFDVAHISDFTYTRSSKYIYLFLSIITQI